MNDLLKQFLKKHDIEELMTCPHGCGYDHRAYKYLIDSEEGWGFVFYDCPELDDDKKLHVAFPLDADERNQLRQLYQDLKGSL